MRTDGNLDFSLIEPTDHAILAQCGDSEAVSLLWEDSIETVNRVVGLFKRRYPWICHADISQSVLLEFPKFLKRYKPEREVPWKKFFYHTVYRATQDCLRRQDPLGIKSPQKKPYPAHLSIEALSKYNQVREIIIIDGLRRLDRMEQANTELQPLGVIRNISNDFLRPSRYQEDE